MPHISLAAETLWYINGFPITNALLTSWLVSVFLLILAFVVSRNVTKIPGHIQSVAEIVIGGLYSFFEAVMGKYTKMAFPLVATFFIYIIFSNWAGLVPGVGTIGLVHGDEAHGTHEVHHEEATDAAHMVVEEDHTLALADDHHEAEEEADSHSTVAATTHEGEEGEHHSAFIPLFRGSTADINTTLALALIAMVAIQVYGFRTVGLKYGSRFLNFSDPINFFVGVLEIISDLSKIVSFAFRLFGNIFAGEVLLVVMAFLMPFLVPLPFLMLELFVGFIQALVFSMLTAVFLNVSIAHGEEHH